MTKNQIIDKRALDRVLHDLSEKGLKVLDPSNARVVYMLNPIFPKTAHKCYVIAPRVDRKTVRYSNKVYNTILNTTDKNSEMIQLDQIENFDDLKKVNLEIREQVDKKDGFLKPNSFVFYKKLYVERLYYYGDGVPNAYIEEPISSLVSSDTFKTFKDFYE